MARSFSQRLLGSFQRVTTSGQFLPEIDGLRFVAIFSVFIYHLGGDVVRHWPAASFQSVQSSRVYRLTEVLNFGVPLFFVISGFILGLPFAAQYLTVGKPVQLGKYFVRRVTRLEPPYVLSMLLFFALKLAGQRGTFSELLPNLAASLAYLHNQILAAPSVISIVAWSLETEIQFYVLAPLLAVLFRIRPVWTRRLVIAVLCLLLAGVQAAVPPSTRFDLSLLGFGQYFLAGFLLADIYLLRRPAAGSRAWDWISLAGWPLLLTLLGREVVPFVAPFLIVLLYYGAFRAAWVNRMFTNIWITTIGGMCYTIYLLHNYAIAWCGQYTQPLASSESFVLRLAVQFLLITPPVLLASALYFRLVERPCMLPDWPMRLMSALGWRGEARRVESTVLERLSP